MDRNPIGQLPRDLDELRDTTVVLELTASLARNHGEELMELVAGTSRRSDREEMLSRRWIFTSREDPIDAILSGALDEQLYQYLSTFRIDLAPLRQRRMDIPDLIDHFTRVCAPRPSSGPGVAPWGFIDACVRYDWSERNVAELRDVVHAAIRSDGDGGDWMSVFEAHVGQKHQGPSRSYRDRIHDFECSEITRVLRSVRWNQAAAARMLSLPEATLRYKVKALGIEIPE
jgi:DNA-binding NtrC family response regulator